MAPANRPAFIPNALPRQKSWFEKNWKWFVPLLTVGALLLAFAFVAAAYLFASSIIRNTFPYQFATQHALESSAVAERLGSPLHVGWFVAGQINYTNSEGTAHLRIPVSGPKGKGTIMLDGKRRAGHWEFDTLEVDVAGSSEPIDLLEKPPPPSNDTPPHTT